MKAKSIFGLIVAVIFCCGTLYGQTVKQARTANTFENVNVSNGIDVIYTKNNTCTIEVEADAKMIDKIETTIEGKTLKIRLKRNNEAHINRMVVHISAPILGTINASGGSGFLAEEITNPTKITFVASGGSGLKIAKIATSTVNFTISGGSDIKAEIITSNKCEIAASGGSDAKIGSIIGENCQIAASGGSDTKIGNIVGGNCQITISGGSDAKIGIDVSNIAVSASSSSDIELKGKTKNITINCSSGSDANLKDLKYETISEKTSSGSDISK